MTSHVERLSRVARALRYRLRRRSCAVAFLVTWLGARACGVADAAPSFADNPIVYFLVTDRFENGNRDNDASYGRQKDGEQEVGTFHGGDLAGVTRKLREGWFKSLGVNAIWITAPYEQIHGWVVGGNNAFRHYAYHGYYALDFTVLDRNMGTPDELRDMIDLAHAQGIRVLFDIVMNHPGYLDIKTAQDLRLPLLWPGAENATLSDYHSFIDYNASKTKWAQWWGGQWVRSGLPGYPPEGVSDYTKQVFYLPDFRTERKEHATLPPFLRAKADTRAKDLTEATVRDYLVTWLTEWVREYGVDGFRCDTVKNVEPESWAALKKAGVVALADWKARNPEKKIDDAPFWMVGEYWGASVDRSPLYDNGFDALINFDFQGRLALVSDLDSIYETYARHLSGKPGYNVLSYISSHDTRLFSRDRLIDGGTALLLAPGGVQIFYGDETARPPGPTVDSDPQQATRSDMNWRDIDQAVLKHWQKLASFRARHVAIARGAHMKLADRPYVFSRIDADSGDRIVVAVDAHGKVEIPVGTAFSEGDRVIDAYTGREASVSAGRVRLEAVGVVLLEAWP